MLKNDPVKEFLNKMIPGVREKIVNFIKDVFKPKVKKKEEVKQKYCRIELPPPKEGRFSDKDKKIKGEINLEELVISVKERPITTYISSFTSTIRGTGITTISSTLPYGIIKDSPRKKMPIITGEEAENIMLNAPKSIKRPTIKGRYEIAKNKVESEKPRPEKGQTGY